MHTVWEFVVGWKDLVIDFAKKYPLAAVIVAAIAIGLFFVLERQYNERGERSRSYKHGAIVFFGGLIAVPILGSILKLLGIGYDFGVGAVAFVYARYEQQPVYCLICLGIAVVLFFVWPLFRPAGRSARVVLITLALVIVIAIGVPLLNAIHGKTGTANHEPTKASAVGK